MIKEFYFYSFNHLPCLPAVTNAKFLNVFDECCEKSIFQDRTVATSSCSLRTRIQHRHTYTRIQRWFAVILLLLLPAVVVPVPLPCSPSSCGWPCSCPLLGQPSFSGNSIAKNKLRRYLFLQIATASIWCNLSSEGHQMLSQLALLPCFCCLPSGAAHAFHSHSHFCFCCCCSCCCHCRYRYRIANWPRAPTPTDVKQKQIVLQLLRVARQTKMYRNVSRYVRGACRYVWNLFGISLSL